MEEGDFRPLRKEGRKEVKYPRVFLGTGEISSFWAGRKKDQGGPKIEVGEGVFGQYE